MLVDAGQRQQRLALGVVGQHLGVADAKVGASGQHLLNRTYSLATWPYLDIQTGVGVIPLGLGHVIAHKLGLMQPAQLQYHLLRQITCPFTGLEGEKQVMPSNNSQNRHFFIRAILVLRVHEDGLQACIQVLNK